MQTKCSSEYDDFYNCLYFSEFDFLCIRVHTIQCYDTQKRKLKDYSEIYVVHDLTSKTTHLLSVAEHTILSHYIHLLQLVTQTNVHRQFDVTYLYDYCSEIVVSTLSICQLWCRGG